MGGKHGKYAYVLRRDGWYVKVRIIKSRAEDDPERYVVLGPKVREAPITMPIVREEELPDEVIPKLYMI